MSFSQLLLVGVVEPGVLEGLEQLVRAQRQRRAAAAAGDVAEGVRQEGLADADWADDRDVRVGFEEAQRDELVPQRPVVGDLRGGVPALELHLRVEVAALGAQAGGAAIAATDLVSEDEQQQVLVGHLLLTREREPLGQRVEHG